MSDTIYKVTKVESDKSHAKLAKDLSEKISLWSLAISDPAILIKKLAQYMVDHPDRVDPAYWFTMDGSHDQGFQVGIWSKETGFTRFVRTLKFGALVGRSTIGANISTPVYEMNNRMHVELGLGAVTSYERLGAKWSPVISLAFHIPIG